MKLVLLGIMMVVISSCGAKKVTDSPIGPVGPTPRSNTEIQSYVQAFKDRMAKANVNQSMSGVSVVFSLTLGSGILGTCNMTTGAVKINQTLWDQISVESREELIFHELGHCVLDRLHNNTDIVADYDEDGNTELWPQSMMHMYHLGPKIYSVSNTAYRSYLCLLYTSPSPRDLSTSRMPSSA